MAASDRRIRLLGHNIRSLWNVGSFFRTCDALQIETLYLTGYTGCPPRKEITKTALGADETVAWESQRDPLPILLALKVEGWSLVALEIVPDAQPLHAFSPSEKVCLIVGHELTGVPSEILSLCHHIVAIPMLGTKESLNVAVAAGIALHHLRTS